MKIAAVTIYFNVGDNDFDMHEACHNARSIADVVKANTCSLPGFIESKIMGIVDTTPNMAQDEPVVLQFQSSPPLSFQQMELIERLGHIGNVVPYREIE